MYIGAHVSSAGGLYNAPKNAAKIGAEVFQMFSRPPQGGKVKSITNEASKLYSEAIKTYGIKASYIHAPYFINLASDNNRIRHSSISILREELERGSILGCKAMMFHPGSAKNVGEEKGKALVVEGLNRILDDYHDSCRLLIEISAGAGMIMGDTFEEIAYFIKTAERGKEIGVCFDTQHAFASGYDIRNQTTLDETIAKFSKIIGIKKLVVIHINDSKSALASHVDRHEHLGHGKIGKKAFSLIVKHPKLVHADLILETPFEEKRASEIKFLKSERKKV